MMLDLAGMNFQCCSVREKADGHVDDDDDDDGDGDDAVCNS